MAIAITTATTIAITIATTATAAITIGFDDFALQLHPQLAPNLLYTIFVHRWLTLRHTIVTVRRYIVADAVTCTTGTTATTTPTTAAAAAGCCDGLDEGYCRRGGLFNGASDLRDTL